MKFSEKTNQLIASAIKDKPHIKFTIGVLHDDKTMLKLYDTSGEIPYESHLYETGSIGKVFLTALLAKYLHEGKMNLDDRVSKYMPELKSGEYYPTLKRLATHTSGYSTLYPIAKNEVVGLAIKQIWGLIKKDPIKIQDFLHMDHEKMIRLAKETKLKDKDYGWRYSNYGFGLLGHAISCVAEKDFWDLMNNYLTVDLGLSHTFLGTNSQKLLNGYNHKNQSVGNWGLGAEDYLAPAGNIASNAEDLLEFAKMNIEESPEYLRLCHVRYDMKSKHSDMGLGWWIDFKNPNVFYHGGNVDGFAGMLAFDKKKKGAVVILANTAYFKERESLFADILLNL